MKLSNETILLLKNFSTINKGIYVEAGYNLRTIAPTKNILASATILEEIPVSFGIYDLSEFLSVMSLGKDSTEIDFDEHHIIVSSLGGRSKIKYRLTDKSMITTTDKLPNIPSIDVEFTLTAPDYEWILKTANVLQSPHVSVEVKHGVLQLTTFDVNNSSAHTNSITIGDSNLDDFRFIFKTDNLRMIPGEYDVKISEKGVAKFEATAMDLDYWVAVESE